MSSFLQCEDGNTLVQYDLKLLKVFNNELKMFFFLMRYRTSSFFGIFDILMSH